jgi:hypothetical protein
MTDNGFTISEDEFMDLTQKQQNLMLFRNTNKMIKNTQSYKFWYKLYTIITGALIAGMGILFKFQLGGD